MHHDAAIALAFAGRDVFERKAMEKNQRIALIAMLAGMTCVLHVLFFEWTADMDSPNASKIFSNLFCDRNERDCFRIFYDIATHSSSLLSVFVGLIVPRILLGVAGFMWLGMHDPKD